MRSQRCRWPVWSKTVASSTQASAAMADKRQKKTWDRRHTMVGTVNCGVNLELLTGQEVSRLATMKGSRRRGLATLCRGSVGAGYVKGLMGKQVATFAVVGTDPEKGHLVGFARCTAYNSFAGGKTRSQVPVTGRIVMLDLICADEGCKGLGSALLRALLDVSKTQFGATILMLEATRQAAGFYARFGFRRVPDACSWPSDARVLAAQRAFNKRAWKPHETQDTPTFRNAAALDRDLGGVWWSHYNRSDNGTLIMSICLGPPPHDGQGRVVWKPRTAASLLAADARGKNYALMPGGASEPLKLNRYAQAVAKAAAAAAVGRGSVAAKKKKKVAPAA